MPCNGIGKKKKNYTRGICRILNLIVQSAFEDIKLIIQKIRYVFIFIQSYGQDLRTNL